MMNSDEVTEVRKLKSDNHHDGRKEDEGTVLKWMAPAAKAHSQRAR